MTKNKQGLKGSQKVLLCVVMAGMLCMLATWLIERINHPNLLVEHKAAEVNEAQSPDQEIANLMEAVGKNPNDSAALYHLAQHLVQAKRWNAAESFIERAVSLDMNNFDKLYLLSVVQHNLEKHDQAAATLEKALALDDAPAAHYSLGILYIYYLNQPEKGREHLRLARDHKDVSDDLKKTIVEELEKPSTTQP